MFKLHIIIFLFLFLFSSVSLSDDNPNNLPKCSDSLDPYKWDKCFKRVIFGNGFKYSGTWKNGSFNGKGTIVDDLDNIEYGDFKEGKLGWQRYDYKKLNGIWTTRSDGLAENIYFYNQWVGFKNIDYVCKILATQPTFIRKKNSKNFNVKHLSFVVLLTNCKNNKFTKSFDNIFVSNKGDLILFQTKEMSPNEKFNPMLNPTFPNKYYPGFNSAYYNSFERDKIDFIKIKKIKNKLTKEEFFNNFEHKFGN